VGAGVGSFVGGAGVGQGPAQHVVLKFDVSQSPPLPALGTITLKKRFFLPLPHETEQGYQRSHTPKQSTGGAGVGGTGVSPSPSPSSPTRSVRSRSISRLPRSRSISILVLGLAPGSDACAMATANAANAMERHIIDCSRIKFRLFYELPTPKFRIT
jgi:hypothetical protein